MCSMLCVAIVIVANCRRGNGTNIINIIQVFLSNTYAGIVSSWGHIISGGKFAR